MPQYSMLSAISEKSLTFLNISSAPAYRRSLSCSNWHSLRSKDQFNTFAVPVGLQSDVHNASGNTVSSSMWYRQFPVIETSLGRKASFYKTCYEVCVKIDNVDSRNLSAFGVI